MPVLTGHVHASLQHQNSKRYSRDPADKTDDGKDSEDCENNACAPQMPPKVVDCCSHRRSDVKYSREPDKLLGKGACGHEIAPRKYERNAEDENEEDEGICIEGEVVAVWTDIDAPTREALVLRIAVDCRARYSDKSQEDEDHLVAYKPLRLEEAFEKERTKIPAQRSFHFGFSILKVS